MTTDAAFLRNQADLASGKASARLRAIADRLEPADRCSVSGHDWTESDDGDFCARCSAWGELA